MQSDYDYDEVLQIKTAWYYYMEGMTQQEIGEHLGLSRLRVNRLLDRARKNGMIQFQIRPGHGGRMATERSLIHQFQLKDALVVPSPVHPEDTNENVALAAAAYIHDRMQPQDYINMGYGDTTSRVLNHLATMSETPVNVVSLTGGVSNYLPNVHSSIFNIKLHLTPTPLLMQSRELVEEIRKEPQVQHILEMTDLASMSIIGIGGLDSTSTIVRGGLITENDSLVLGMKGAVGDLLGHFIDENGQLVPTELEYRLITLSLDCLKNLNHTIGVAAGARKVRAILAALRGNYLNVLITDETTAEMILDLSQADEALK